MKVIPLYILLVLIVLANANYSHESQTKGPINPNQSNYPHSDSRRNGNQILGFNIDNRTIIIYGLVYLTIQIACLAICLKFRQKRQIIKQEMKLKRMEYERMMGIEPNQRFNNERKTVHI